ncbi:hypothetical protein AGABI2DRAFT_119020 [Agaricus bisporus var. bisporus H97]|uniref:hypothetical protein n=1 Tax=Agaricus bisporus var. bisporus (strain H97 / ATCC MYA-4626 / FGSC 10389) TaxID=936046 RepID=UPI00029F7365|nr:hypothetical protein AGABI2DRAFT_119020 [Agaricus bisporus var. bisporus H97]EKV46838.1 hypothetical protein AGABI2DRAFT_119020 [Agaricus bisporus var. bisporus H97]
MSHDRPAEVDDPRSMLTSPFVLSHLSAFTWSSGQILHYSEWYDALSEYIRFPALKEFCWEPGQRIYSDDFAELLPLFKFPQSVTTVQLASIGLNSTHAILDRFSHLTDLTRLQFSMCDAFFVERAFTILSWGTDENDIMFPKLTDLIIDYRVSEAISCMVFHVESGKNLVGMLRRRIGLIDKFTLTVGKARMTHHWDDEIWDALRELKRDGLDLTITENEHPITI